MPHTTYEQNKAHIYKWRAKNLARVRTLNRKYQAKYVTWKEAKEMFLAILRDWKKIESICNI